jgi:hypothetical protein
VTMASKFRKLRFYPLNYGDTSKKHNLLEKRDKSSKEKTSNFERTLPQVYRAESRIVGEIFAGEYNIKLIMLLEGHCWHYKSLTFK